MKKVYKKPVMEVESFEANEYVAACYVVTGKCSIYNGKGEYTVGEDELWHGAACQNNTFVYSDTDCTGWENGTGHTIYNVNISAGTWNSNDAKGNVYYHHGTITVDYKDPTIQIAHNRKIHINSKPDSFPVRFLYQ